MMLTNSEDEDKDNFHFLQELRQTTTPTPEPITKSTPLNVLGFQNLVCLNLRK
jgi:hypothetical protein